MTQRRVAQAPTVAELAAITKLSLFNGQMVELGGYRAPGDKASITYVWDETSEAADNGGTVLALAEGGAGRFIYPSSQVSILDFGAYLDETTDDTLYWQAALDAAGAFSMPYGMSSGSRTGISIYIPPGRSRVTDTLFVLPNTEIHGAGLGSQITFDPTVPETSFMEPRLNTTGGTGNKSNWNCSFRRFYVSVKDTGGTIPGFGGSGTYTARNTSAKHCFNFYDTTGLSFIEMEVTDFLYGTAFYIRDVNTVFSYYNNLKGCRTRDCLLDYDIFSACTMLACSAGESSAFPADALGKQYQVKLSGRGCSVQGGALEGSPSVALVQDSGTGSAIVGVYTEAKLGNAFVDVSGEAPDTNSSFYGGNSHGYTYNILVNENHTRTGTSNIRTGLCLGLGDAQELEIREATTNQTPSFRYGLPGHAHTEAGGTVGIANGFVDRTSIQLVRGESTEETNNTVEYSFYVVDGAELNSNVYVSFLMKIEGGEDNYTVGLVSPPQNTSAKRLITYGNGWELWGTYVGPFAGETLKIRFQQIAGSTDTDQKISITALRAYVNGFAPFPAPFKYTERRTAAPTGGAWALGDIVWNAQPSAGGAVGWMCTDASGSGTWPPISVLPA